MTCPKQISRISATEVVRSRSRATALLLAALLFLLVLTPVAAEDSQCVTCHTSGRTLTKITRIIEDERGNLVLESPESVGEG